MERVLILGGVTMPMSRNCFQLCLPLTLMGRPTVVNRLACPSALHPHTFCAKAINSLPVVAEEQVGATPSATMQIRVSDCSASE